MASPPPAGVAIHFFCHYEASAPQKPWQSQNEIASSLRSSQWQWRVVIAGVGKGFWNGLNP